MIEKNVLIEMVSGWSIYIIGLGYIFTFWRLVRGPDLADRVVALDLIAALTIGLTANYALLSNKQELLNIPVVIALITFLSTVAFARYIEKSADNSPK